MKAFLDTSVLIATFYGDHERHEASINLFLRHGKARTCSGAHCLAEVYSTLTGMPAPRRVGGREALLFIEDVCANVTLTSLEPAEYFGVVRSSVEAGISGGAIYDALLAECALKSGAEAIYTWNTRDFLRLAPEIASRVRTP